MFKVQGLLHSINIFIRQWFSKKCHVYIIHASILFQLHTYMSCACTFLRPLRTFINIWRFSTLGLFIVPLPKHWAFSFVVAITPLTQLIGCPCHYAIQPFTNHTINSLLVIWLVPLIFQYNVSISFLAFDGSNGLVVLNVLTLPKKLAMFVVVKCSFVNSCFRSNLFARTCFTS